LHNGTNCSRIQREKHVAWKEEMTNSYQILHINPEWRSSERRRAPSRKGAYLIYLAEYRVHREDLFKTGNAIIVTTKGREIW
jgi:hypothetical protein